MTAEQILVIILAAALAVFLVLSIVLVSFLIAIAKRVNEIVDSAEQTVEQVQGFVTNVRNSTMPTLITGLLADLFSKMAHSNKKSKED